MRAEVTGSRLPILQHCQHWAREDFSYTRPESGAAAGRGSSIHDGIDTGDLTKVAFEDLEVVQRGRAYLQELRDAGWMVETEVPIALNYVTGAGRRLKSSGHRDYSDVKPDEIGMTLDYLALQRDPAYNLVTDIELGDWKTGYGLHVERASENWQLGGAAAAMSARYGDASVMVKIHYLDTGHIDSWQHSAMSAQRFTTFIRNRVELVAAAQPQPGDHCRYCPAQVACPKTQTSLVQLLPERVQWTLERLSEENDAAMVVHLPQVKAAVEAIERALKERCKEGLPLPNGKVWKPVVSTRQGYDTKKMAEYLGPVAEQFKTRTEYEQYRQVKP